jgi:hypothetical protein
MAAEVIIHGLTDNGFFLLLRVVFIVCVYYVRTALYHRLAAFRRLGAIDVLNLKFQIVFDPEP